MPTIPSTLRHHSLRILLLFVFVLSLKARCLAGEPAHWPQWRGQDGEGISLEKDLPGEWKPDKNIQWKVSIAGRGHSSPIVWGNRIFVTTAVEGEQLPQPTAVKHMIDKEEFKHPDWVGSDRRYTMKVLCLDGDSGKILWEANAYEGTVFDHRHRKSSYASPTPVTDGENVYVYFGSEGVYAYSFNGNLIWKSSLGGIRTIGMGVGTSPVLFENLLIVQVDEDEGEKSFLVALNKNDGHEVWRTPRKVQVSWSTPLIVNTEKRPELITSGSESHCFLQSCNGKGILALQRTGEQCRPFPGCREGYCCFIRRVSRKKGESDPVGRNWRSHRNCQYSLGIQQRDSLRRLPHCLWRLCLPYFRQRNFDLFRIENWTGDVRQRTRSSPGNLHVITRRV